MLVQIKDFDDVAARARSLGCRVPVSIALLPGNFSKASHIDEFHFHPATPDVRSAWRSVGLEDEGPLQPDKVEDDGPDAPSAHAPLSIFFGSRLLGGPTWCLTVALGMVSSVLASHPCCANHREIRLDVVVERPTGGYACLEYRGDACELVALAREVLEVRAGSALEPFASEGGHRVPARA